MTKKTIDLLIRIGVEIAEWASVILRDKKGNGTKTKSPGNEPKKS